MPIAAVLLRLLAIAEEAINIVVVEAVAVVAVVAVVVEAAK